MTTEERRQILRQPMGPSSQPGLIEFYYLQIIMMLFKGPPTIRHNCDQPPSHNINHLLADLPRLIAHLLGCAEKTKKALTCDFGKLHKLGDEVMKCCWKTSVVPIILTKAVYKAVHFPKTTSTAQCHIVPNQKVLPDECRQFRMIVTRVDELVKMLENICLESDDIETFIRLLYVGFMNKHSEPHSPQTIR